MIPHKQHRMMQIQFASLQYEAQSARALERAENEGWPIGKAPVVAELDAAVSPRETPRQDAQGPLN